MNLNEFPSFRLQNGWKLLLVVAILLLASLVFDFTLPKWFAANSGANYSFSSAGTQLVPIINDTIPYTIHASNNTTATITTTPSETVTNIHPKFNMSEEASMAGSICRVLISNRVGDFHYEILESVALQYPIDWERHSVHCHHEDALIVIDYFLDFKYKGYTNNTEAWGWLAYFEQQLQGRKVQRHAALRMGNFTKHEKPPTDDRRWIQFGRVVDAEPSNSTLDWQQYHVLIEANCGFIGGWEKRLQQDKTRSYCVLHSASRKKVRELQLESQICYLNPQHASKCWFLPSDFPKFEKSTMADAPTKRVCIGWKADKNGEHRDTSLVAQALEHLQPDHHLQIVVIGRKAKIPRQILQSSSNLSHYVTLESSHHAFYEYQRTMSQCDALLPLIHPHGASAEYFMDTPSSGGNKGKLSGMISQCIGNAIPAVIHSAIANIYRPLFTAPIFEYNETKDPASFINAFRQMMDNIKQQ